MRIQQKCPICEGHGIVSGGFYHTIAGCSGISNVSSEPCRNCNGSGVVYIEETERPTQTEMDETSVRLLGVDIATLRNAINFARQK